VRKREKKRPLGKRGNIGVEDFKTGDKETVWIGFEMPRVGKSCTCMGTRL
jgi:hypothetical protein